jgi:hypothetical protein
MTSPDLRVVLEKKNKDNSAIRGSSSPYKHAARFLIYSNQLIRFLGSRITLDENADKRSRVFFSFGLVTLKESRTDMFDVA